MTDGPLYFDHNATTPLLPEVVDAMLPFLTTHFGNPSSGHVYGRVAKEAVEQARMQVAALVGVAAHEVVFTSGGTEATALALRGVRGLRRVVTTRVEHPATARLVDALERDGLEVTRLRVAPSGLLVLGEPGELGEQDGHPSPRPSPPRGEREVLSASSVFSVIHAHNETGVLQPLPALAALAHSRGALLHVDASQSAGKVPLSRDTDGFDLLTLAAHKLYGPKGVGALVVREGVPLQPQQLGAGHERGLRAGTENVAAIVGFGAACVAALRDLGALTVRLRALRDRLERGLVAAVPNLVVVCAASPRLPNTSYVLFPGVSGSTVLARAPGLAASTGSACHDGHESPAQVLLELGFSPDVARGAVRLTLGRHSTEAAVDACVTQLTAAALAR